MDLSLPISVLLALPELSVVRQVNEPNHFAAGVHLIGIGESFNTTMHAALVSAADGMLLLQGTQLRITGGLYYRTVRCGDASIAPTITTMLIELGWNGLITTDQIAKVKKFGIEMPSGSTRPRLRLS